MSAIEDPGSPGSLDDNEPVWRFQYIHGRRFTTNTRDETYILPTDDVEHYRQDIQHYLLKAAIGGNCGPKGIPDLLGPRDGPAPGVLDLGCGTGTWAIEMADEYPHAEVLGIDLVKPVIPTGKPTPVNCRFEVDDINLSLDHYAGTFDLIHGRIIDPGVRDYPMFLDSCAKMLRPNGMLLLVKPELRLYDKHRKLMPIKDDDEPGFVAIQRISVAMHDAVVSQGDINEDAVLHWREMILANPNFDPATLMFRTLHIPISPWIKDEPTFPNPITEQDLQICSMMRQNLRQAMASWTPLLLKAGHSQERIDSWVEQATDELEDLTVRAYLRYTFAWVARRPGPHVIPSASTPAAESTLQSAGPSSSP